MCYLCVVVERKQLRLVKHPNSKKHYLSVLNASYIPGTHKKYIAVYSSPTYHYDWLAISLLNRPHHVPENKNLCASGFILLL